MLQRETRHFRRMNAPHSPSPLAAVPMAAPDPILGVGVYTDNDGKIPLLESVRHAEGQRLKTSPHRGYLPIDGLAAYDQAVQGLVFGAQDKNIVTVQALGGTGGLRIGAD